MKTQKHVDQAMQAKDCARGLFLSGDLERGPTVGGIFPGRQLPLYLQIPASIGRDAAYQAVHATLNRMVQRGATAVVYVTLSWAFEVQAFPPAERRQRYLAVLESLSRGTPEAEIEGMRKSVMVQYSTRDEDIVLTAYLTVDGGLGKFEVCDGDKAALTAGTLKPFERFARSHAGQN